MAKYSEEDLRLMECDAESFCEQFPEMGTLYSALISMNYLTPNMKALRTFQTPETNGQPMQVTSHTIRIFSNRSRDNLK
jgi:hypothetical protein